MRCLIGCSLLAVLLTAPTLASAAEPIDGDALSLEGEPFVNERSERSKKTFTAARSALDADKVVELVSKRLERVSGQVLRELIANLGEEFDIAPIRDLSETLPLLLSPGTDLGGRSHIIEQLALRLSISAALGNLLLPRTRPEHDGEFIAMQAHRLYAWEAAYHGLAQSKFGYRLGFPESIGQPAEFPKHYHPLAEGVTAIVDTFEALQSFWEREGGLTLKSRVDRFAELCQPELRAWAKGTKEKAAAQAEEAEAARGRVATEQAEAIEAEVAKLLEKGSAANLASVETLPRALHGAANKAWHRVAISSQCLDAYDGIVGVLKNNKKGGWTIAEFDAWATPVTAQAALMVANAQSNAEEIESEEGEDDEDTSNGTRITQWKPWLLLVQKVLRSGVDRSAVRALSGLVIAEIERLDIDDALSEGLIAVFEELPLAVREQRDSNGTLEGITLDVTVLADGLVRRYAWANRPGWYVRATVGAGYWSVLSGDETTGVVPAAYEEIGGGWRAAVWDDRLLIGPHLAVSGLLHQVVLDDEVEDGVLLLAGASVNIYSALDVSVGGGWLVHAASDDQKGAWLVLGSFQIPLIDYLADEGDQ